MVLELEQVFEDENVFLTEITAVAVDQAGNVYLLDRARGGNQLVSYSPDGTLRWIHAANGRGPGELQHAFGLALVADDMLVVENQRGSRYDWFSLDGTYLRTRSAQDFDLSSVYLKGKTAGGRLVGTKSNAIDVGSEVLLFDPEKWTLTGSFATSKEGYEAVEGNSSTTSVIGALGEEVFMADVEEFRYTLYNEAGTITRELVRPDVALIPPAFIRNDDGSIHFSTFGGMMPLVRLNDRYAMGGARWPTNITDGLQQLKAQLRGDAPELEFADELALFDLRTNAWIASVDAEANGIGTLLASDHQNHIYATLSGDEPILARFRVNLSK